MGRQMEFTTGPFGTRYDDQAAQVRGLGGKVFYVNPAAGGDDDVDTPFPDVDEALCFATLQAAIDATTADRGDVVIVKRGAHSITETVSVNKAGISIIAQDYGCDARNQGEKGYIWPASTFTTGPCLTISAPCYIEGLGISSRHVAGSSVLITGEGGGFTGGWIHINRCRIPDWIGNSYGIDCEAGAYLLIEGCQFEGFTNGINFNATASNNPTNFVIRDNHFHDCTYAVGFEGGTPHNFLIQHNVCIDSKLLDHGARAGDGLVSCNYLETATDDGSYDEAVNFLQADGIQISGNYYAE